MPRPIFRRTASAKISPPPPGTECRPASWSRVITHQGDDGDTYSVDIFYEYEAGDELQRSNRYSFGGGSSSGRGSKRAIVKRYPHQSAQVCFVDPDDPLEAVLKPKLGSSIFLAIIPAVFVLIGGGGLAAILMSGRKDNQSSNLIGSTRDSKRDNFGDGSSRTFRPGRKRLIGFFIAFHISY